MAVERGVREAAPGVRAAAAAAAADSRARLASGVAAEGAAALRIILGLFLSLSLAFPSMSMFFSAWARVDTDTEGTAHSPAARAVKVMGVARFTLNCRRFLFVRFSGCQKEEEKLFYLRKNPSKNILLCT